MRKYLFLLCLGFSINVKAQTDMPLNVPGIGHGATINNSAYRFTYAGFPVSHYGLGWYMEAGQDPRGYLSGYGGLRFFTSGNPRMSIGIEGNVGIGTLAPSSFFHGGNNRVLEIFNPNTTLNSQSHIILSTGSTLNSNGAGTLSWISRNSTGFQGMAYIGSMIQGDGAVNSSASLIFATSNGSGVYPRMVIDKDGNTGIGTSTPNTKLAVNGKIRAQEIKVETANWPDYVFAKDYQLPSLKETEQYIKDQGHLPGIPSAEEVKANGVDLGEMNAKLLKKIEELTLHLIELKKENQKERLINLKQQEDIKFLKSKIK